MTWKTIHNEIIQSFIFEPLLLVFSQCFTKCLSLLNLNLIELSVGLVISHYGEDRKEKDTNGEDKRGDLKKQA